jgi:hypothetical protein
MRSRLDFPTHEPSHRSSSKRRVVIEAELTFRGISRAIDSGAVNRTRIVSLFDHAFGLTPITPRITGRWGVTLLKNRLATAAPVHAMVRRPFDRRRQITEHGGRGDSGDP